MSTTLIIALVTSALIASLNPCVIGVFVTSIASLIGAGKHPRHAGIHSVFFALGVGVWTLSMAVLSLVLLSMVSVGVTAYIGLGVAGLLIVSGIIEIKDYFWYGRGVTFKLGRRSEAMIHSWTKKHHSHQRGFLLGLFSSAVSAHYTLALLVASMIVVRLSSHTSLYYAGVWAAVYSLPLFVLAMLVVYGVPVFSFANWKEQSKAGMRLGIGLLFVIIGWVLILSSVGGVSFL